MRRRRGRVGRRLTLLTALLGVVTSQPLGLAAHLGTYPSDVTAATAVVQSTSPIPGFADSLKMIRDLLDRGRGIEAEKRGADALGSD